MPSFAQYEAALSVQEKLLIKVLEIQDPLLGIPKAVTKRLVQLLTKTDMLEKYVEYMREKITDSDYVANVIPLNEWLKTRGKDKT